MFPKPNQRDTQFCLQMANLFMRRAFEFAARGTRYADRVSIRMAYHAEQWFILAAKSRRNGGYIYLTSQCTHDIRGNTWPIEAMDEVA